MKKFWICVCIILGSMLMDGCKSAVKPVETKLKVVPGGLFVCDTSVPYAQKTFWEQVYCKASSGFTVMGTTFTIHPMPSTDFSSAIAQVALLGGAIFATAITADKLMREYNASSQVKEEVDKTVTTIQLGDTVGRGNCTFKATVEIYDKRGVCKEHVDTVLGMAQNPITVSSLKPSAYGFGSAAQTQPCSMSCQPLIDAARIQARNSCKAHFAIKEADCKAGLGAKRFVSTLGDMSPVCEAPWNQVTPGKLTQTSKCLKIPVPF